jgi:asparagine synthase (glutamine-hydrolysing)
MIRGHSILVCNGEIYNYRELLGEDPQSSSDCEGILHLYDNMRGLDIAAHLDGDFAFAMYGDERGEIIIARDPVGVRPLFHHISYGDRDAPTQFIFASEMKAIHALDNLLYVQQFPPGCTARIDVRNNSYECSTYWNIFNSPQYAHTEGVDIMAVFSSIRSMLTESVRKRLISDRPIGCLLSGGLDSSLIAALVQRCMRETHPDFRVHTFSIGMEGSTDLAYARTVAEHIGSIHREIIFTPQEGLAVIPELVSVLETYDITTVRASVGMYLLSKWISENTDIKVIFSGEGADELAQGYIYFHKAPNAVEADEESRRLMRDLHLFDVLRADRTISHFGLEARVPFLDKEFIRMYLTIPASVRVPQRSIEKYLIRSAFEFDGILPNSVLWRKKEAFSDGISAADAVRSWHAIIAAHIESVVSDEEFYGGDNQSAPLMPPRTKEQYYYWKCFADVYGTRNSEGELLPYIWMPRWFNTNDPSARTLDNY